MPVSGQLQLRTLFLFPEGASTVIQFFYTLKYDIQEERNLFSSALIEVKRGKKKGDRDQQLCKQTSCRAPVNGHRKTSATGNRRTKRRLFIQRASQG